MTKSKYIVSFLLFIVFSLGFISADKNSYELSKNIDIFASLFKELNTYYINDIDPNELVKTGIDAMLKSLDPYTNYIPEEKIDDYYSMTTGEYYGIGAKVGEMSGKKVILMPIEGYSAYQNGLEIGDEIVEINGISTRFKSIDFINKLLKGHEEETVALKIKKYGTGATQTKHLYKDLIKIKNVPYYGKLAGDIGYIKLNEFTFGASDEVEEALLKLKAQGAKKIILDLRNNPGGLLNEAIDVSNVFIEKGKEIVTTKGKVIEWNKRYNSLNNAVDSEIPLAVLINQKSASASEIVAGVMQDYDRGILIGERTFGKGLVQATRSLSYNSKLKITTAKYFIPSGRCIQSIDYNPKDDENNGEKIFHTLNGREVYDGKGIDPDIKTKKSKQTALTESLTDQGLIFDYANYYYFKHPQTIDLHNFMLSDEEYEVFLSWLQNKDFTYRTQIERDFQKFAQSAKNEGYEEYLHEDLACIESKIQGELNKELLSEKDNIITLLEKEILVRYYLEQGEMEAIFDHDPAIEEAMKVLNNHSRYNYILQLVKRI